MEGHTGPQKRPGYPLVGQNSVSGRASSAPSKQDPQRVILGAIRECAVDECLCERGCVVLHVHGRQALPWLDGS
jgi:hypothetical protein